MLFVFHEILQAKVPNFPDVPKKDSDKRLELILKRTLFPITLQSLTSRSNSPLGKVSVHFVDSGLSKPENISVRNPSGMSKNLFRDNELSPKYPRGSNRDEAKGFDGIYRNEKQSQAAFFATEIRY